MLKPWLVISTLLFSTLLVLAISPLQQAASAQAPAAIPADAAKMTNPVTPTAESQTRAKKIYGYDCALCHGANGNGKGDVVADLKLTLKDWTDPAALKDTSDGEMFYVIKNGKGQMPPEGERAKDTEVWNMVILIRSFSKK